MIGVLEITLIVPTLRVGMPLRKLRVRSRMWRRCLPTLQRYPRYPRHALGSLNPQSVPFVTRSVTGGIPTQSDGHDQCWGGPVYNAERGTMGTINILPNGVTRLHASAQSLHVTVYNVMDERRNL